MRIHYVERGQGAEVLVLVHGWNCDLTVWRANLDALAAKMRVIAIDLPGHGASDQPAIDYTMELHARAIDAVLHQLGVDRAILVGHSNGTPVIRQFYRLYPHKTKALVIVDGALRPFAEGEAMEKYIAPMRGDGYRDYLSQLIDAMLRSTKDDARRNEIRAMMLRAPLHVALSEMEGLLRPELWAPDRIEIPTLMLLAKQPAWNDDYERFVRELVPKVEYHVWKGVSHFLMSDEPAEFNAAVLDFVERNPR